MTSDEAAAGPADDPARLADALSRINDARKEPAGSPARVAGLLDGFESLAASLPGSDREPAGAASLAELEGLLESEGKGDAAAALRGYLEPILDRLIESLLDHPERRLAAYGSLLPGEDNHHHVAMMVGRWIEGEVEGTLVDRGWAARQGYPGYMPRPGGGRVPVKVFESLALPGAWERLDAFEGSNYRRILSPVETSPGPVVCNIYAWIGPADRAGRRTADRTQGPL